MKKIIATGLDDFIEEDRPAIYLSHGDGNTSEPEVHIHIFDPEDGTEIRAWFKRDELLDALNASPLATLTEPEHHLEPTA